MAPRAPGFTLLEVLIALLVITTALLGLLGTLGPLSALAGQGRLRWRIALVLESRLDRLRAELLEGPPGCVAPAAGSMAHPDGIAETWSTAARGGLVEISISAGRQGGGPRDSLVTRLPCP